MLRQKEWTLLARDPWLMSQTLMQILYLLPPALLLWVTFRSGAGAYVVLVPVVVMAAGQLAGGLAWLSISGEDAPDLVATAPITAGRILRAKIEAVMGIDRADLRADRGGAGVRLACSPPWSRRSASLIAAAAATLIQLCFRTQAQAQPVPPPADLVAHRDLCGSVLVDRLGRDLGAGGSGQLDGARSRADRALHPGRRAGDQSATSH